MSASTCFRPATRPARKRPLVCIVFGLASFVAAGAGAQSRPSGAGGAFPLSPTRTPAGTAWQPDDAPMAAIHVAARGWRLMLHGAATVAYVRERAPKGGSQVGSTNWLMASAARPAAGGLLTLTAMASAETVTQGSCGLPRLLGTSGLCDTDGYRDYQHVHPPLMELGARWDRPLAGPLALELFAALAGQPALGPPGYAHRVSAASDPVAPISEHELDPSHVSAGVLTAGVHTATWKLEASAFDGGAVDEDVVFNAPGPLRSFAGRASWNPAPTWSLQLSAARIEAGEGHHAGAGTVLRVATASATHARRVGAAGAAALTGAWAYMDDGLLARNSVLLEGTATTRAHHTFFGRAELADRAELAATIIEHEDGTHEHFIDAAFRRRVGQISAGYRFDRDVGRARVGVGGRIGVSVLPDALVPVYRARRPLGFALFGAIRPASAESRAHVHTMGNR